MSEVENVQGHLAEDYQALEAEIASLRAQLRSDQDPNRMQLIQSMISVCVHLRCVSSAGPYFLIVYELGTHGPDVPYTRESF